MTFPGQGTSPDQSGQAVPSPQPEEKGDGGIRQWLIDTYNGLYVIVLKPRMPEGILYGIGLLGLFLGILWAYVVAPVDWSGGNPNRLNTESQQQWLLMTAVGTSADNLYAPERVIELAQAVPNPRALVNSMLADPNLSAPDRQALQSLLNILPDDIDANSAQAITANSILTDILWVFVIPLIVMIILIIVVVLLWRFLIYDNLIAPVVGRIAEIRDPELAAKNQRARDEIKIQQQQRALREQLAKESVGSEFGNPVMTQLAIYAPGRNFDESYEIELESGDFLGQSGAVIAEAVDPDPVAIEVWLFDMFTSKNIAKVFVTPQGNADPAIRSKLEADVDNPATDIIVAAPGAPLQIDTDKLRLEAKFANLNINPSGRFENFNLQMRAWNKDGASAPIPTPVAAPVSPAPPAGAPPMSTYDNMQFDPPPTAPAPASGSRPLSDYDNIQFDPPPTAPAPATGSRPMSDYDDIQFDPPPAPPSGFAAAPPPTTSGGFQPLQPPPLSPSPPSMDEDDDPFGGTGDFTPLGS